MKRTRAPFLLALPVLVLGLGSCLMESSSPPPPAPPPDTDLLDAGESFRSFSPSALSAGQTLSVSCMIWNAGSERSGSFVVRFYASDNTTITTADPWLGTVAMDPLGGGDRESCDLLDGDTTGLGGGTWWIGWIIDPLGEVREVEEGNNTACKTGQTLTVFAPDVDLHDDGESYRSFSPTTVTQGSPISVSCDVRNGGTSPSGAFTVRFYASVNTTISASDHEIGSLNLSSLDGGGWTDCDLASGWTSSVPPGTYWVGWILDADGAVSETDESNNTAYKQGYQLTVTAPPTVDLYDDGEAYRSLSPSTVVQGGLVHVSCDIRNGGTAASGAFDVDVYASTNTVITTADYYLGTVDLGSISAGSYADCDLVGASTAGIPEGAYWVGWIIDGANHVVETDENNNTAYKTATQLTITSPTYTVTTFPKGMTSVRSGATLLFDGSLGTYYDADAIVYFGFSFKFFGQTYTSCRVSTNGYLTFGSDGTDASNDPLPDANLPDNVIALFWDDLVVGDHGITDEVFYRIDGAPGSRVLTVEYRSVSPAFDTSSYLYGQIKLYEALDTVELCYDTAGWGTTVQATIGIEDASGTLAYDGPTSSPYIGTEPVSNWRFTHD